MLYHCCTNFFSHMATVRIVLRPRQNRNGERPLAVRVTKDRKSSFIFLGHHLAEDQWDEKNQRVRKSHPNSTRLNNFILKKLAEINDTAIELETETQSVSSQSVKQKIKPQAGTGFFAQADLYIGNLRKAGKFNRVSSELPRINRFREFMKGSEIRFSEITPQMLENFKAHLLSTRNINERTAVNHLSVIRSVFSLARKSDASIAKTYPFGKGKIVIKFPDSMKIGLTSEDVRALEELDLQNDPPSNHARNIWLFSFYFAGIRISDALRLKWTDIQNDRLFYSMGKNTKSGSLKIPQKAQHILAQYQNREHTQTLIFPDLDSIQNFDEKYEVQRKINVALSRINKRLKIVAVKAGVNKKLTTHIARHTFGNISGDQIPIQMLQKLYRHSSITTTIGYQSNFINKEADDALDKVLGF